MISFTLAVNKDRIMFPGKMSLSGTSGLIAPDDLIDKILLSQQFIKKQPDIVGRMPVKVYPESSVRGQKISHHEDPY